MTTPAEIASKDPERAEIERLFAEWTAAGHVPEYPTTCRTAKTMATLAESNAATWKDRR